MALASSSVSSDARPRGMVRADGRVKTVRGLACAGRQAQLLQAGAAAGEEPQRHRQRAHRKLGPGRGRERELVGRGVDGAGAEHA